MIATLSAESITHASNDDMPAIHSLITACDIAVIGCAYFEGRSVFERWGAFEFDPNEDTLLRRNIEGQIVGYEGVLRFHPNGQIDVEGYVHPNYVERGIGTYLLRWAETRAREQISLVSTMQRHYLQSNAFGNDLLSRRLLEVEGYYTARHHRHMEIDMLETPVPAKWPTGISVRTFIPNKDEHATWTVWNEIFVEEWGYVEQSFEEWLDENEPDVDFDPSLWFLAMDDEQIIGLSCGTYNRQGEGWINYFGMRPAWRKRGIALALLHHSFGEFYRRGKRNVGLGVDSQNPTSATLFYERGGMHATLTFDTYQKDLLFAS